MRTDQNLGRDSFRYSSGWKEDKAAQKTEASIDSRLEGYEVQPDGKVVVHSLSGNETNRLFMNQDGADFKNTSAISGLDNPADSRGWALLDYDRDGWQDVAIVNANNPLMSLYHNNIGTINAQQSGGIIALRFVGGGKGSSPRDGYGAIVSLTLSDGTTLKREHRCGDGYASQNSATMIIGIGDHSSVSKVTVRWPSGKTSTTAEVAEGTLLTVFENRPTGAFTQKPYRSSRKPAPPRARPKYKLPIAKATPGKIQVYTTTATWCTACLGHLPSLAFLKAPGIALFGIPVDPNDTPEMLEKYLVDHKPPYEMLADLSPSSREEISSFLAKRMRTDNPVLPSTIIADSQGNVLEVMSGIPTLSQVRPWLHQEK